MTLTMIPVPTSGNQLSDIIDWVRRIIKTSSDQSINDYLIADYVNRFYTYEMPERLQLFELKRQYTFETVANTFIYQFPFQLYQMVKTPVYCDGVEIGLFQTNEQFYRLYPEFVSNQQPITGDGTGGPYSLTVGEYPILRAFVDDLGNLLPYVYITMVDASGQQRYIVDSGTLNNIGEGILIETDSTFQNIIGPSIANGGSGVVNYLNGTASFTFQNNVPAGAIINVQTSPFSAGTPRACLIFNNQLKLYPVPTGPFKIQLDCYVTPAQFLTTAQSVPFAYMSEYIARGAARKILSDDGDYDQFQFYEPLFKEQENFVLRRTERQNADYRTPTIFSGQSTMNPYLYTNY